MDMFWTWRLSIPKKSLISLFFDKNISTVYKFKYKTSSIYNTYYLCTNIYKYVYA